MLPQWRSIVVAVLLSLGLCRAGCAQRIGEVVLAPELERIDAYTLRGPQHFVHGYEPRTADGMVQMVVEIPAGTSAKWEVDPDDGLLKWEFRDGKPRIVSFLPYPGNYGMIPRTMLPQELGGDGDPLDILVVAPAVARGSVIPVRLIGVLQFWDGGEQDDKLIAVMPGTPLGQVESVDELRQKFPSALEIVQEWFIHYKGSGEMRAGAIGDTARAQQILDAAMQQYRRHQE